ncbi:hypothetical protein Ahy_A04g018262 isoform C [Arachis hypogaea]|uniref:Uncharacterized protein n=1 Tax=Arachis hypogaea TaxID=3818 RepID=A0A445DD81_ARAHY|nr:hypothetical protein Ahy_A04g018262 isoform C [Arachis hypogaea]
MEILGAADVSEPEKNHDLGPRAIGFNFKVGRNPPPPFTEQGPHFAAVLRPLAVAACAIFATFLLCCSSFSLSLSLSLSQEDEEEEDKRMVLCGKKGGCVCKSVIDMCVLVPTWKVCHFYFTPHTRSLIRTSGHYPCLIRPRGLLYDVGNDPEGGYYARYFFYKLR